MLKKITLLFCFSCFAAGAAMAQSNQQEANLKAVFLYNFTRYIDWGERAGENEFTIGIIGNSGIDKAMQEVSRTNFVNGRHIVIKRFNKPEEIGFCNILFVPSNCPFPITSILDKVEKGVLTVSEKEGEGKMGIAFNFVLRSDKLKFEANLTAITLSGLKASSQLLKLAIIIN